MLSAVVKLCAPPDYRDFDPNVLSGGMRLYMARTIFHVLMIKNIIIEYRPSREMEVQVHVKYLHRQWAESTHSIRIFPNCGKNIFRKII